MSIDEYKIRSESHIFNDMESLVIIGGIHVGMYRLVFVSRNVH